MVKAAGLAGCRRLPAGDDGIVMGVVYLATGRLTKDARDGRRRGFGAPNFQGLVVACADGP